MTGEHPQSDGQPVDQKPDGVAPEKHVDSGETIDSLFRSVKGIRENVKQRAMALLELVASLGYTLNLSFAPIADAVDSQINQGKLALERIKDADHESAHFLLSILNNSSMKDIWLSPYGDYTSEALSLDGGQVSGTYREPVSFGRSSVAGSIKNLKNPKVLDASKLSDESIARYVFLFLSGDAVNIDNEGKMIKSMGRRFSLSTESRGDTEFARQLLKTTKYKNVAKQVFDLLTDRIMKFLSDPGVRKIVDIFSVKLLESGHIHKSGESIVPMMMELLEENGVRKEEFEGFQRRYDEMVKTTAAEMRTLT